MNKHVLGAIAFLVLIRRHVVLAFDSGQCFIAYRNGSLPQVGGINRTGLLTSNVSDAVGFTYQYCVDNCGKGAKAFDSSKFARKFAQWLLPWLALTSQLPFGAARKRSNLLSLLLTVGSPTLGVYSLSLTILNEDWATSRFSHIEHENKERAIEIMKGLQQAPLSIRIDQLEVLVRDHSDWWEALNEGLDYNYTWTLPALASISWVFAAYVFTLVDAFATLPASPSPDGISDGIALGNAWLWLWPLVYGWLQISPKCDSTRLRRAVDNANALHPDHIAISIPRRIMDAPYGDDRCTAPIFNYARFLPWTRRVEEVAAAFEAVAPPPVGDDELPVNVQRNHWGPNVTWRFLVASAAGIFVQWGTTGAALLILCLTPTTGLSCRSLSYLIHASVSTLVWAFLVASSFLTHALRDPDRDHDADNWVRRLAIAFQWIGKFLGVCNGVWLVLTGLLQFSNLYNNCFCNSNALLRGKSNAHVIVLVAYVVADVRRTWAGGVALACTTALLFAFIVWLNSEDLRVILRRGAYQPHVTPGHIALATLDEEQHLNPQGGHAQENGHAANV